jgi:hypothetical protein
MRKSHNSPLEFVFVFMCNEGYDLQFEIKLLNMWIIPSSAFKINRNMICYNIK